jgi:hypothetical protein
LVQIILKVDRCGERGPVERERFIAIFILRRRLLWRFHRADLSGGATPIDRIPFRLASFRYAERADARLLSSKILWFRCRPATVLQPSNTEHGGWVRSGNCWKPVVNVRSRDRGVPGRDCQLMQIGYYIRHRIDELYRGLLSGSADSDQFRHGRDHRLRFCALKVRGGLCSFGG